MSDVFISYSRANAGFAHKLAAELKKLSYEVWVDVVGIPFTSEWWAEIRRGIESADNFVLVMSPDSLGSPVCHLEIEYARQLNKRIIPINHVAVKREDAAKRINDRILDDAYIMQLVGDRSPMLLFNANWQVISGINWFNYPYDATNIDEAEERRFYETLPAFVEALNVDMVHVRQHTRLLTRAKDWLNNEQNPALLLVGEDVASAEKWLNDWEQGKTETAAKNQPPKAPQPTDEIQDFINASRQAEDERQRQLLALETSRQRSDTAARNARRTLIGVAIVSPVILLAVVAITSTQVNDAQNQVATATIAQGLAQFEVATATIQVATAVALQSTAVNDASTAVAQVATATFQQGRAEENAADARTAVGYANSTATQIPPTLTQAAIVQDIAIEFGNAILQSDTNSNQIIARMDKLIERYPEEPSVYRARALAYDRNGEFELAIADFNRAIALNPVDAKTYINRGATYAEQGEFELAIADFNQAIVLDPLNSSPYNNRALVYRKRGELDQAIEDYNYALVLDPKNAVIYSNRGFAYAEKGEFDRAIADSDQAIALDPQSAIGYTNRGYIYKLKGEFDRAILDYTQAISLDSYNVTTYINRGSAYALLEKYDLALQDFTRAIELQPNEPKLYAARAVVYSELAKPALSLVDFELYEMLGGAFDLELLLVRAVSENQLQWTATPITESPTN